MKKYLQTTLGGLAIAALFFAGGMAPATAYADTEHTKRIGSSVEVGITDGGKVLVRGAKVTAISGSTITAQTTFGSASLTWTVSTGSGTTFSNAQNASVTLGTLSIGDTISFVGSATSANIFAVQATAVKDWTKDAKPATVSGTITAINGTNSTLTLQKNGKSNKTYTVSILSSTALTLNGTTTTFGNLAVNDGIKVVGTLSADGTTLSATSAEITRPKATEEDRDFSKLMKLWFSNKSFFKFH